MNRTENDLRDVYMDPSGIEEVERRLLDTIGDTHRLLSRSTTQRFGASAAPIASAVAVIAIAVAAVVVVPELGGHAARKGAVAQNPAPVPTPRATTSPSSVASPQVTNEPITAQYAVQTLISLLPRTGTTTKLSGTSSLGFVGGSLVYSDGQGAAELGVGVTFPYKSPNPNPQYLGKIQREAPGSLCTSQGVVQDNDPCTTLPNGSQVAVYQGDGNIPGGAKDWEVMLLRTDGVEIDITEWNAPIEKGGAQTRTDPPFSISEVTTIASSTKWQATITNTDAKRDAHLFVPTLTP